MPDYCTRLLARETLLSVAFHHNDDSCFPVSALLQPMKRINN